MLRRTQLFAEFRQFLPVRLILRLAELVLKLCYCCFRA